MAIRSGDENSDLDLEETIRRRLRQQTVDSSMDPTASASESGSETPTPSAPFTEPKVTTPGTPVATQPTQAPVIPAFGGGGGPPQPQDPYYRAYQEEHPNFQPTVAPIGPQINYDNSPLTGASAPTSQSVLQTVQSWPNPYGHADPDYWVKKILSADEYQTDPQGVINYFRGRYLEDPSNNPHSPQNQSRNIAAQPGMTSPLVNIGQTGNAGGNALTQSVGLTVPQGVWSPDFVAQLRAMLMERLKSASEPVDPNAPQISQPLSAARDEAARATEKERTDIAENLYAHGGLNTDALSQAIQQSGERTAIGLGTLRGTLIQREVESKRSELRDLMQMALAAGDAGAAREIQAQIAALSAVLQREGFGVQLAMNETNQNRSALGV